MADNTQKISDLDAIQQTGAKRVTVDGVTTEFDQELIARRKRELESGDDTQATRRPRIATINLKNAF